MSNYITITDLVPDYIPADVFRMLTCDDSSGEPTINVDEVIAKQQSEIDESLQAAGYAVPITSTVPRSLRRILCELVRYALYARKGAVIQTYLDEYNRIVGVGGDLDSIAQRKKPLGIDPLPATRTVKLTNKTVDDASMTLKKTREAGFPLPSFAASIPTPGGE